MTPAKSITFVVTQEDAAGGYVARAHWASDNRDIFTEGDDRDELIRNVREAVDATFGDEDDKPTLIHLHYVRDEVFAR